MTSDLFTGPLAQAVGWALLHVFWQATIVAALLAAVLTLLPRTRADLRYALSCLALAMLPLLAGATAWRSYSGAPKHEPPATIETNTLVTSARASDPASSTVTDSPAASTPLLQVAATAAQESLPYVVLLWAIGVTCFSIRLLISWTRTQRLARSGASPAAPEWQRAFARLGTALRLRRAVELLESSSIEVPTVIGWLKPVVLIPASALGGLTPQQLEMVLAHELAHIRRHDFFINLLQTAVETLMFYHPAVWWISHRVRVEREHCCDDLAISVCGNPVQYARALTRLEELRVDNGLAMAANGGSLMDRIRRIVAAPAEMTNGASRWMAAAAVLVVVVAVIGAPAIPAFAEPDAASLPAKPPKPPTAPAKVKPATARVDVTAPHADPEELAELEADAALDMDLDVDIPTPEVPEVPEAAEPPEPPPAAAASFVFAPPTPIVNVAPAIAGVPALAPRAYAEAVAAGVAGSIDGAVIGGIEEGVRAGIAAGVAPRARVSRTRNRREFGTSGKLTVDELIELRAVGVTPEYIKEMRSAGLGEITLGEITTLRVHGVNSDYIRSMRSAGVALNDAEDVAKMRAMGVNPAYVEQLAAAGYRGLTADDLAGLKAVGVSASFVKSLREAGYTDLSIRDLKRLAATGINADFIRDMAQYRDTKKDGNKQKDKDDKK